ncbi:MAG: hypothetical protein WCJ33_00400 [Pseudomonadota bacterium]
MKARKTEQDALIRIINGIYSEIFPIEENLSIRVSENDFRARIEYFHDAVRLLSSAVTEAQRLSVEFLGYDAELLRHITANPIARKTPTSSNLSPSTALQLNNKAESYGNSRASQKAALSDNYRKYSVLYVALFAENAENDYKEKTEQCNNEVEEIAGMVNAIKGKDTQIKPEELISQYIDDDKLAEKLNKLFAGKGKKIAAKEAVAKFQVAMKESDAKLKTVEKAHFSYTTNQLAIYESAVDIVKKMASGGLNIAGVFVENAVRDSSRGDRGR